MPTSPLPHTIIDSVTAVEALDVPGKKLGKFWRNAIPKGPIKDALSGTPLGHAFHPLMTDVPIGAWMSAGILDALGEDDAAEKLLAAGLAAAAPTFVSGWNDWADTEVASDGVRRVGIVHAVANGSAAALFTASLIARRRGDRGRGKLLSTAGLALLGAGGWLGGHLSYAQGVGVDNTVFENGAQEWTEAMADVDLAEGRPACVEVDGDPVLLVRQRGRLHALANRCTHRGGPLHEGELGEGTITCPWHATCFKLEDGSVERGPAAYPQPVCDVRTEGGRIQVRRRAR